MTRLLPVLAGHEVGEILFEARQHNLNIADRAVITSLRQKGLLPEDVRVDWVPPVLPPLWAADALAGAITWWLDGDDRYWSALRDRVELIDVEEP